MGIVAKQSIYNTVIIFTGAFLGAINILFLFPIILPDEEIGLTRLLLSFTVIFSQFASLGSQSMLVKFIPKFRVNFTYKGSATYIFKISIIGFIVSTLMLFFGKPIFDHFYLDNSSLFITYFFYLIPLILFQILINYFSGFLQALFKSVFPLFVNEILIRVLQTIILILFYFSYIDFEIFMLLFVLNYAITSSVLLLFIFIKKYFKFNFQDKISKSEKIEVIKFGFANTLTGFAGNLTNRIDLLMIGSIIGAIGISTQDFNKGLYYITIYSIASYMAALIEMPARALANIASTFVSKAWKENDITTISSLYKKSSTNQLIIGLLIFIGVWASIDNLLIITGKDYSEGKYVFLFLGLAKLFNVAAGINGKIIMLSKHYIVITYLTFSLAIITFISNLYFIPLFEELPGRNGIEGAAIATALSIFAFNIFSFLYLKLKFDLQPYTLKTILIILFGILSYISIFTLGNFSNIYLDIMVKSLLICSIFIPLILLTRVSTDINDLFKLIFKRK